VRVRRHGALAGQQSSSVRAKAGPPPPKDPPGFNPGVLGRGEGRPWQHLRLTDAVPTVGKIYSGQACTATRIAVWSLTSTRWFGVAPGLKSRATNSFVASEVIIGHSAMLVTDFSPPGLSGTRLWRSRLSSNPRAERKTPAALLTKVGYRVQHGFGLRCFQP